MKKKSEDPAYAETQECKDIEAGLLARALVVEALQAKGKDDEADKRAAAVAAMPESAKKELVDLGVELPTDTVTLHLDLGDLLMCAYYSKVVMPAAPVAKARVQMRLQRLAAESQKDDFELDAESLATIDGVISDDDLWKDLQVETYVFKGEEKITRICNSQVVSLFPEVLTALVEAFAK
jgi:hypothetical protein